MKKLSKKQEEVLNYIHDASVKQGYPPSVREICEAVGLRSPSSVHAHIKTLNDLGYIVKSDRKTRAINVASFQRGKVPILGTVTAGNPILAIEEVEGYVAFDAPENGDFFALRVRGDSMIDAGILDGDIIIARRQQSAVSGEIVVAMIGEEATVKTLNCEDGRVRLVPENSAYEPIDGSECTILGQVKGLIRNY